MTLVVTGAMPHANGSIEISASAAKRARMSFNPSANPRVDRIKTLAAALYTECEVIKDEIEAKLQAEAGDGNSIPGDPVQTAGREAATAMTHIQAGAMFAVSAATAA